MSGMTYRNATERGGGLGRKNGGTCTTPPARARIPRAVQRSRELSPSAEGDSRVKPEAEGRCKRGGGSPPLRSEPDAEAGEVEPPAEPHLHGVPQPARLRLRVLPRRVDVEEVRAADGEADGLAELEAERGVGGELGLVDVLGVEPVDERDLAEADEADVRRDGAAAVVEREVDLARRRRGQQERLLARAEVDVLLAGELRAGPHLAQLHVVEVAGEGEAEVVPAEGGGVGEDDVEAEGLGVEGVREELRRADAEGLELLADVGVVVAEGAREHDA